MAAAIESASGSILGYAIAKELSRSISSTFARWLTARSSAIDSRLGYSSERRRQSSTDVQDSTERTVVLLAAGAVGKSAAAPYGSVRVWEYPDVPDVQPMAAKARQEIAIAACTTFVTRSRGCTCDLFFLMVEGVLPDTESGSRALPPKASAIHSSSSSRHDRPKIGRAKLLVGILTGVRNSGESVRDVAPAIDG